MRKHGARASGIMCLVEQNILSAQAKARLRDKHLETFLNYVPWQARPEMVRRLREECRNKMAFPGERR